MFSEQRMKLEDFVWIQTNQEKRRYEYGNSIGDSGKISDHPVFFDLGAFKGDWSKEITKHYGGTSHLFEILPARLEDIKNRLSTMPGSILHEFALAHYTGECQTGNENQTDGFSLLQDRSSQKLTIYLKDIADFIQEEKIDDIDICKINIEGAEFDLLEYMICKNLHLLCKNIQVQFHWQYSVPNFYDRWVAIREELMKSHKITVDFYFIWENWSRK
jgi:FkbM family methyltransferase